MIKGILISRRTKLSAPKGQRKVLVFGVLTVSEASELGDNKVHAVTQRENSSLCLTSGRKLSKKMQAWTADDTLKEMFKLDGTREPASIESAEHALRLTSSGKAASEEAQALHKPLKLLHDSLPVYDMMRQVVSAVVSVIERASK